VAQAHRLKAAKPLFLSSFSFLTSTLRVPQLRSDASGAIHSYCDCKPEPALELSHSFVFDPQGVWESAGRTREESGEKLKSTIATA